LDLAKEETTMVLKLTEGLGLTEAGIQMFEVGLETALSSNNCKRNYEFACYGEILT
jgi:hypothetical protein